ncbi:MAG: YeeE/YedE thiosulfate transporter family protein [Bacteroidota bacterium]|nr:YeeE/YedE thiosulfate transporter family protein [Bacteroidota bacterium]MDP4212874.1 YeeE/YedE thiosulfate transporter family protein [Bacteroidota bacterium]MDP4251039.1 YeeE/YedE thiosulfate transporter family protein [Bacteroidota bacterium]
MKAIKYILAGIVFGIIMTKSEAVSWYRIQEMFRFQSFFMYGIMGSAVVPGILVVALIKRFKFRDITGTPIYFPDKDKHWKKYLFGGTIFGLGWALTGACPGPLFVLLGCGYGVMLLVIAGALLGTFTYGIFRDRLPQ